MKLLASNALYPVLADYLRSEELGGNMRINERCSSNLVGSGGNEWLHPDLVLEISPLAGCQRCASVWPVGRNRCSLVVI